MRASWGSPDRGGEHRRVRASPQAGSPGQPDRAPYDCAGGPKSRTGWSPSAKTLPQRLIAEILPDLLVISDYKPEEIAGYAEVTANGGEVRGAELRGRLLHHDIIKTIRERG